MSDGPTLSTEIDDLDQDGARSAIVANFEEILDQCGDLETVVSGLENYSGQGAGRSGEGGIRTSGRGIRLNLQGNHRASVTEIRAVFSAEFRRSNLRHRIVHTIYERSLPHEESDREIFRDIKRTFHGTIFLVASHGNHYHVIHDCNWSSSSCRCARIRSIEYCGGRKRHRYNRKVTGTSSWNIDHWINLLLYLDTAKRSLMSIEISGVEWLRNNRGKFSTLFKGSGFRLERGLESIRLSDEDSGAKSSEPYSYPGNEIDTEYHGSTQEAQGRQEDGLQTSAGVNGERERGGSEAKEGKKTNTLLIYLKSVVFSPPKALFASRLWLKSQYRYVDRRKTYFTITYQELKLFYVEKTILEIWSHFLSLDPLKIFFASENPGEYYYDIRYSVRYLEALLNFQFHDDVRAVKRFLKDLRDILDKRRQKTNTFFVLGEANSGKNFFFDTVCHFMVNYGIIANWNRHNQFPLQDCINRRLLLWNEPNYEDGVEETLKMLFGGDQCPARVKYEGDAVVQRTPVIILSNNDCFPRSQAFRTRMIKYQWRACEHLRNCTKKPHPLAFGYLLARWNIINWKSLEYEFEDLEQRIFNDITLDDD